MVEKEKGLIKELVKDRVSRERERVKKERVVIEIMLRGFSRNSRNSRNIKKDMK